jgi:hypothetical protein
MDIASQHNNVGADIWRNEIAELNMQITQDMYFQKKHLRLGPKFQDTYCTWHPVPPLSREFRFATTGIWYLQPGIWHQERHPVSPSPNSPSLLVS